jgi:hypothetical protein
VDLIAVVVVGSVLLHATVLLGLELPCVVSLLAATMRGYTLICKCAMRPLHKGRAPPTNASIAAFHEWLGTKPISKFRAIDARGLMPLFRLRVSGDVFEARGAEEILAIAMISRISAPELPHFENCTAFLITPSSAKS